MAILFALLALFGWGVGDIFVALASRKIGAIQTYFWGSLFGVILTSLYIPFAGGITSLQMFLLAVLLNIFITFANLSYFRGLEVGNASLVGTIAGSFSIITVFLSIVLFRETVSWLQFLGILLAVAGVILASFDIRQFRKLGRKGIFSDKGVFFGLFTMIIWGIYFAMIRIPAQKIGWFWTGYPMYFVPMFFPLVKSLQPNISTILNKNVATTVSIYIFLVTIGTFSYNIGILQGLTSVVAPISGAYPVLFVLLTRTVFKEPLTRQQSFGIASSLLGILLISIFS